MEALKIKTHELDSKVDYIKSLEVDLAREKRARENAERRASRLSGVPLHPDVNEDDGAVEEAAFDPPSDNVELMNHTMPNGHIQGKSDDDSLSRSASMSTIRNLEDTAQPLEDPSSIVSCLQAQLDLRNKEMTEMKLLMESYRQKAEEAEEGRKSLAEMVENIRAGRDPNSTVPVSKGDESALISDNDGNHADCLAEATNSRELDRKSSSSPSSPRQRSGSAALGNIQQEIEKTMSNVLQQHQREWADPSERGRMVQSAPYVSMVGVVLIGVGIMTWLNGWQPGGGDK